MPIVLAVCSCLRRPRYPFFVCTGTEYFLHVLCLGDQGYLPFAVKTLTPHCIVKLSASPMSVKVIWAQFHAFKFHMYSTEYIDQIRYPLTTFQLLIIHSDWTLAYIQLHTNRDSPWFLVHRLSMWLPYSWHLTYHWYQSMPFKGLRIRHVEISYWKVHLAEKSARCLQYENWWEMYRNWSQ